MTTKFIGPIEVPIIPLPSAPDAGFVMIYGRGEDSYALFPDGTEKILTAGTVVAGDRDIDFAESVLMSEAVALSTSTDDSLQYSDIAVFGPFIPAPAIVTTTDTVNDITLDARQPDSLAVSGTATVDLTANTLDTATVLDNAIISSRFSDTGLATATRQPALLDAQNWADTVVSNTNFTSPANAIDISEATLCLIDSQQTAISGAVTTTGQITVSLAPYAITPTPVTTSVKLVWGWQTGSSGLLQSGNSTDIDVQYSLNNGSTFATIQTITSTIVASVDVETTITATYSELQQLRFRLTGSVTSGTAAALDARQFAGIRYIRAEFTATQTL